MAGPATAPQARRNKGAALYCRMLRRRALVAALAPLLVVPFVAAAQTRQRAPVKPTAKTVTAPADITCPSVLGTGVTSPRQFCDVLAGRDPKGGIIVTFPSHRGPLTLAFDLHNRETYSEEEVKAGRAFAQHTATIGVLTLDNTLLTRAVVQTEFRTAKDLFDRVAGGAGAGGVKAVAPVGDEHIIVTIPDKVDAVSILGEKLTVVNVDGTENFSTAGRPIAIISNVTVEYTPAPVRKTKPAKPKKR